MPKEKPECGKQTSVRTSNIATISGRVNVAIGNITTYQTIIGLSAGKSSSYLITHLTQRVERG